MRWAKRQMPSALDLYVVDITIIDPASVGETMVQLPLLLPHELFGALYAANATLGSSQWAPGEAASPGVWEKAVLGPGGQEAISDFWEKLEHMEWVQRHPALSAWGSRSTAVPIGFHGDGAQFTREESMTALTWSSVMATGASLDSRFLITALPTTWLAPGTLDEVFSVLAWSFAAMLDGFYPPVDHKGNPWCDGTRANLAGKPLAGGFRGVWAESRGDWDWQVKCYRLRGWSSTSCCHLCDATPNEGPLVYTDFSNEAPWRATLVTHDQWMAEARDHKQGRCPLCEIPGWHLSSIKIDTMHTLNLGFGMHVNGNLMLKMCSLGRYGPLPRAHQLKRCWLTFKKWCAKQGLSCSQRCFTKSKIQPTDKHHPELRIKAWNSRLVSAFLAHELCGGPTENDEQALMASLAWALSEFYLVMELGGRFLADAECQRLALAGDSMLQFYHGLAKRAAEKKKLVYGLRPKMHMVSHLCMQVLQDKRNPRFFHCFKDEDMIGKTVKVAAKCHRVTISFRMMQRYMLRLSLRWQGKVPTRQPRKIKRPIRTLNTKRP